MPLFAWAIFAVLCVVPSLLMVANLLRAIFAAGGTDSYGPFGRR